MDVALFAVAALLSAIALVLPEARTDRIAAGLRRTVFAPISSLQARAERARHALLMHDSLTAANDVNILTTYDATRLAAENDHLRRLIGLGARLRTGFVAAEAIHAPRLGEEHTMLLDVGSSSGVTKFSPLIAPEGIIGYVRSVDVKSSVAIVWPHPDFRVSAMAFGKQATGIIAAHLGDGATRFLLELRGVPYRAPLDSGTLIVSSGIGGTFPRGIPVGRVIRQLPSTEGWVRNYLVMPSVHPADVGTVLVLLPFTPTSDLTSIWIDADSAAAALKRVAVLGDSLNKAARDSARAKADTARVKRDSVERASRDTTKRQAP
ncbi:MAG TPA: rod shape-determining protein MreC [Gemmatimonadaceae bacterium]|nr:rod shape-determining protein MreC [Gemmatimonadaceae bacterium]